MTDFFQQTATVATSPAQTGLDYDAVAGGPRRKAPRVNLKTEDRVLNVSGRKRMISTAKDLRRNFALAVWMISKHLDYVANFKFHCRTDNEAFNTQLEKQVRRWSRPNSCDRSGRFTLRRMLRMIEGKAVLDGDAGFLKLTSRRNGRIIPQLQGIEGDRVRDPGKDRRDADRWTHGIKTDEAYRHLAYAIHRREAAGGFSLERIVSASSMIWHNGYVGNFDQVRGVSPLACALNPMRDVYENFDLALARAKISQLFAFAITKDKLELEQGGPVYGDTPEGEDEEEAGYDVDFGRGPLFLELEEGHDAKFLESAQPSSNFQAFTLSMIQVALKSLDIPYSFYSEDFTNFFGSRAAVMHYERACEDKREALAEMLRQLTVWLLQIWIINGELTLPRGWTLADLDFEWVAKGIPWWDPAKEIRGDLLAIGAGLDTPQRICKERDRGDYYDNLREIKKAKDAAEELGLSLSFSPDAAPAPTTKGDE